MNDAICYSITVSVPYSTGEQYEGAAHLIQMMTIRAIQEREAMITSLLSAGQTQRAYSIPAIGHAYTMLFFSRESKVGLLLLVSTGLYGYNCQSSVLISPHAALELS